MKRNLSLKERAVLVALAEYRVLSVSQLTALCFTSQQMARKTIRKLTQANLVNVTHQTIRSLAGRPENTVYLGRKAVQVLKEGGVIGREIATDLFIKIDYRMLEHQLLANWVRIALDCACKEQPDLAANYLNPITNTSLYQIDSTTREATSSIIPDGVFSLTHTRQRKSLLFFVEVDMGTETLSSSNLSTKDIRKKVFSYRHIFKKNEYKKFEQPLESEFRGFRVLFVTETIQRLSQLCRLLLSIRNTDFIWVADKPSMFEKGIYDKIWIAGGDTKADRRSILGTSLAFKCPLDH